MDNNDKILIQQLVDNRSFAGLFNALKDEIASEMLDASNADEFLVLRADVHALVRLQGKLIEIANEVRMTNAGRN